jgi:hypothetical protein
MANHQEEINKQLNQEYDTFLNSLYTGKVDVPSFIVNLFKKAIMAMPPFAHKINFFKVKAIAKSKPEELTNGLLNDIVKVILNTPLEKLYSADITGNDFYEIIDKHIELEKFVLAYNNHIDDFRKKLELKKATLESLTRNVNGNGLRVIPQA